MDKNFALKRIIEQYMGEQNLSQADFARKCDVSKSFINKIINRKLGKFGISEIYFKRLAKGMNITSDTLHDWIDNLDLVNLDKTIVKEKPIDLFITDAKKLSDEKLEFIHSITKEVLKCKPKRGDLLFPIIKTVLEKMLMI